MKLRDFVANSLPRVRGRKKKGQSGHGATASISAAVVAAAATSNAINTPSTAAQYSENILNPASPRSGRQDGNGNWFHVAESRFGFLEKLVGKDSPVKRLFETKDRSRRQSQGEEKTTPSHGHCSSSLTEPSSPYGSVGVWSPVLGDKPVFHSQHASPVSAAWAAHDRYHDWDSADLYGDCQSYPESLTSFHSTPGSQGGPRNRSRIRTNPWLPSPRPSPYSVRSLSSPCTSSRSASPSSSPLPPSSSDSTSPLTSVGIDVNTTHQSQLHRQRRHRRHHSEIKASDLTRLVAVDTPLTDTEQCYSTLDSGIGDSTPSPADPHPVVHTRRPRSHHSKRRIAERELQSFATSSSSPKPKPRVRTKTRPHASSSRGLIANRDSKFWDSDSSSRSPPRTCRSVNTSKDSLHFENTHSENCIVLDRSKALPRKTVDSIPGYFPGHFLGDTAPRHFYPASVVHESCLLSPGDDICIITSNIEQLAQNISSEYEEGIDVSFESMLDSSKQDDGSSSLRDVYSIDSEDSLSLQKAESSPCEVLDYPSFARPLHRSAVSRTEREESPTLPDNCTLPDNRTLPDNCLTLCQPDNQHGDLPTMDVAVQTDFADDDEEDNSGSDWLLSTESSSDWVTSNSNGSGSDWPISAGSDWPTGEGSATEEEEEGSEEERESDLWVEGSRLWIVPDVMHNSTDTGYSSLSRDGRVVTDDNNNSNNNNSNDNSDNSNNTAAITDQSQDSASGVANNMSKTSDCESSSHACPNPSDRSMPVTPLTHPETPQGQKGYLEDSTQHVSYTIQFNIIGGSCSKTVSQNERSDFPDKSTHCSKEADFFVQQKASCKQLPKASRSKGRRHSDYDHVVPYPYDVRRFSDVILSPEERERSISPVCFDDISAERMSLESPFFSKSGLLSSTPSSRGDSGDVCKCVTANTSSDFDDVTSDDAQCLKYDDATSEDDQGQDDHFESCCSSILSLPPPPSPLPVHGADKVDQTLVDEDGEGCTGRTLQEVRASLEDKVNVLRQGKRLVNKKIREAQEEERVHHQHKLRFQRLLEMHRRRVLLETLQGLRERLESQSARLQASYSSVLNLQKRYV